MRSTLIWHVTLIDVFSPLNKVPLVKACRFLRLLVLYLYSWKMVALGVLERLACEKRMMAKYFTYLLIGNYILLVKQHGNVLHKCDVFFRINQILFSPDYKSDPVRI